MLWFDFIAYAVLLGMFILATRVRPLERITLRFGDEQLTGVVLMCPYHLSSRVGLLNTPRLAVGDGLFLCGVKSVHTKGMHFPIDLVFLDEAMRILEMKFSVEPGAPKISGPKGTRSTLELGQGTLALLSENISNYSKVQIISTHKSPSL